MNKLWISTRILLVALVLTLGWSVYAATKGNVKYEVTDDRIVVSCVDGQNPILRTVPRPRGGYYAVVVCGEDKP